ncbi:hypothetical protein CTA2_337 [Colletotrichum tanaceti]|uniref:Extracellular membrane protein CFEM domain-containing protein n=1 Tax=Colletotrichum tanaceti TaxID=1306861 RepID=A0A4U6X2I7_9PEZI|nr:hypothetical protein CTA2_337 [Colletotrichum tanaceti]TKW49598.1 hypothetical protein CTA1_227 [Colletotrichum tanaceti]
MAPRLRHRTIPTSSLVLLSYLVSQSRAAFVNDFSAYPASARPCMNTAAAASGCAGNTVREMNTCLCGNGGNFVMATAKCVKKESKFELDDVYEVLLTSCTDSQTPLAVSQAQFLDPEEEDDDDDDDDDGKGSEVSLTPNNNNNNNNNGGGGGIPSVPSIPNVGNVGNVGGGGGSSSTFATSITTPPPSVATPAPAPAPAQAQAQASDSTYESVAPGGVTVTVTKGTKATPTGAVVSGQQGSKDDTHSSSSDDGYKVRPEGKVLAAGITAALAVVIGAIAFLCYRRRRQRKERKRQVGASAKFASMTSATSLTTMTATMPQGQAAAAAAHHGANNLRPNTANSMQMAVGTAAWGRQQQQQQHQQQQRQPEHHHHQQQQHYQLAPQSPSYWQNNSPSPNPYGQTSGGWPSPVTTNTNGTNDTNGPWGVSPVSQNPTHASREPESPSTLDTTRDAHAVPAGVPAGVSAPHPSRHPSDNTYAPVFELPGDEAQAVEADSTPIGQALPIQPPSRSIQSTPTHMSAPSAQLPPAPATVTAAAHRGMPNRQIDDALQISQVELPPPRYSGPDPDSEWDSDEKKFG